MGFLRRCGGEVRNDRLHQRCEILHPHGAGGRDALRAFENLRGGREGDSRKQPLDRPRPENRREHQDPFRGRRSRTQVGQEAAQDLRLPFRVEGRDALRHFAAVRDSGENPSGGQPEPRPAAHAPRRTHPDPQETDRLGGRSRNEGAVGGVPAVAEQRGRGRHGLPHRPSGRDVLFALAPLRDHRGGVQRAQRRTETRGPQGRGHGQDSRARGRTDSGGRRQPPTAGQRAGDRAAGRADRLPGAPGRRPARRGAAAAPRHGRRA